MMRMFTEDGESVRELCLLHLLSGPRDERGGYKNSGV